MGGPIFSIPLTFSEKSGGRTTAVFQRASELATAASPVTILTFNFRTRYPDLVARWLERTDANQHVHHLNLFEHFAGESIFDRAAEVIAYEPPSGVKARMVYEETAWVLGKGPNRQMAFLNDDGSLNNIRQYRDGVKTVRIDVDSRQRPVRRLHFAPEWPDSAAMIEYFTHRGRVYLETMRDAHLPDGSSPRARNATSTHRLIRPDGQVEDLASTRLLRARFIADLAERHAGAVFIVDDRSADEAVIDNPWVDDLRAIVAIHSAHRSGTSVPSRNANALARSVDCRAAVVLTREQADDAVSDGLVTEPPHVIPHAAPAQRGLWGTRWGGRWRRRRTDVVMVTRLVAVKQVDHAIAAFALVVADRPGSHLTIWGIGELEEQLRASIDDAGLGESITMAGYAADPLRAVGAGRLSISTSQREGFGLVTAEALSQGTPVVTYRHAYGPRDMIEDGVNGLLIEPDDPQALAAGILQLLSDPRRLRRMSRAAAASMRPFQAAQFRSAWNDLLEQVRRPLD